MIEMFTGKPGGGKSYGGLLAILDELENGNRDIVTNMALDLNELNAYFQRKGRRFVDVFSRVRMITREEAGEFWRYRGNMTVLPIKEAPPSAFAKWIRDVWAQNEATLTKKQQGEVEERLKEAWQLEADPVKTLAELINYIGAKLGALPRGVLYIIDEAHVLFDARRWLASAVSLTIYNSQHRKFDDHCVFVTQFLKLIEVRVRGFAERFRVYRNFTGTKALLFLRMPSRMREMIYGAEPGPGVPVDEEKWRALDAEKAKCYDTMAGVGVAGGRKPEVRRVTGFALPWWSPLVGLFLLGLGIYGAVNYAPRLFASLVQPKTAPASPAPTAEPPRSTPPPYQPPTQPLQRQNKPKEVQQVPDVTVEGVMVRASSVMVMLSDGRTLRNPDLAVVTEDYAQTRSGEVYWRRRILNHNVPRGTLVRSKSVPTEEKK